MRVLLVQSDAESVTIFRTALAEAGYEVATATKSIAILKPEEAWREGVDFDDIQAEMNAAIQTPGVANMWSMPIKNRLDSCSGNADGSR